MNHKSLFPTFLLALLWGGVILSCSTTEHLPAEEQLYTGIDEISYNGFKKHGKGASRKEGGVIRSISNAASAISQALEGKTYAADTLTKVEIQQLTKEQRKAYKAEQAQAKADWEQAKTEVEAVLAYPPNNAFFGSSSVTSPLKLGLWAYNAYVNDTTGFGKWMFKTFASTPVLVSAVGPDTRAKVGANTLRNYGFFQGYVVPEVRTQKNPRKAKIAYNVVPGLLWRYDSIEYRRYPPLQDSLIRATLSASAIRRGKGFSALSLNAERIRISNLFRENGYYFYTPTYTAFRADTLRRRYAVQMQVQPAQGVPAIANKQWYIGTTHVTIHREQGDTIDNFRKGRSLSFAFNGKKLPLRPYMWRHALFFRRGDRYRLSLENLSLEKLNEIGVFSHLDMAFTPRDSSALCDTLDVAIHATMDKVYTTSLELNGVYKGNQQMGPGLVYELAKKNAFGGGEKVSFKIFGSYEWQTGMGRASGSHLMNSYEVGTQLGFEFPRILFPFLSRRLFRFPATTTFALDVNWKNRAGFYQVANARLSANYTWHKTRTVTHSLTPFSLEYTKLLHKTAVFDSIMHEYPALMVSMRNQFVPSMSYTMTYASAAHHRNPVWIQVQLKEAGNLTNALYSATGHAYNERDKKMLGSPFAQFVKLTAEIHHTTNIRNQFTLASRFFAGAIYTYGNSFVAPYSEQFYVGGANSVRGFAIRSVGPGKYRNADSRYAYIDQTGDLKLEANVELRRRLMGNLHGAVFLDAGNVWTLREDAMRPEGKFRFKDLKNIAVGTGVGLRYDMDFLILRFDLGIALHAPYETGNGGWYNIPKFKDGLAFHFAIGYPF